MVLIGEEFLADVGALSPFPECFLPLIVGIEFFKGKPIAVNGEAFGEEITAAEPRELGTELAKPKPSGLGILFLGDHGLGRSGQMNRDPAGEFGGQGTGQVFVAESILIVEVLDELEGELLLLPLAEAALPPFGEIDGVNGLIFKVLFENGLDLRHRAEPLDEGFGVMAVLKALVKLFAEGVGETSDFSFAGVLVHHIVTIR